MNCILSMFYKFSLMFKWLFSLMLFTIFNLNCSSDDSEELIVEVPLIEKIQEVIDAKVGAIDERLVGVSLSIRIDGEEMWTATGGVSKPGQPINEDMIFGIASITKTVVAATILKLEEQGLLSLEDRIDDHLSLDAENVNDSITIFQLLAHFTGVKGYFQHPDIWPRVESNLNTAIPSIELVDYIGPPINKPGRAHEYSNSNYLLLGLIIEKVTGKNVGELMREFFWEPLGLRNTYFGSDEPVSGTMAIPWRDSDGDGVLEDISDQFKAAYFSVFYCAAGIYTTASDLSNWAYHLYEGDVLSQSSKDKMFVLYGRYDDPTFIGYGLGVRQNVYASRQMWGHTGGMRGYGSHMFHDPRSKVSIAILNNQSRSENGPRLRHELIAEVLALVFNSLN